MSDRQYSSTSPSSGKGYNHRTGDGERIFSPLYADVWDTHLKHMNGSDVKVYIALLMHTTQKDRTWFLSIEELAEDAGVSRASASRAKDRLVEVGLVEQWWRYRAEGGEYRVTDTPPPPRMQAKNLYKVNVKPVSEGPGDGTSADTVDAQNCTPSQNEQHVDAQNEHLVDAQNEHHVDAQNEQQTITPQHNPINRRVVTVLPKVTDTHAREENPLEDFEFLIEEPPLRGDTHSGFNESNSISEGEVVVSEPDHPWSESAMLNHRPEHLRTVAEKYAKKPHASRCPVHEHAERSVPCQSCKQVRLYAEEIADRLAGKHSEEKARRKQEINACRLCDPRGMASYVLPDGSPQAVTCQHSSQWFDEFLDEVSERFLADRAEEQRQREARQVSRARDEALAKVRELRRSRSKAS